MSRTGRPKEPYADFYIQHLTDHPDGWYFWAVYPNEADRVVRKLKREGFEAKRMMLDPTTYLLAARNTQ